MAILLSLFLVAAGFVLEALGLLFLIAAAGRPHRLLVAVAALGGGAICIGNGVRKLRAAKRRQPGPIADEILAEARRRSGAVSEVDLRALLGDRWELAQPVLGQLVATGICRREARSEGAAYLFSELQPRLAVRRCKYCSAELPFAEELVSCPKCGGLLQTSVERAESQSGDYRMDE
jgi:Zn finger protein HypA/HybF involved in hydrogenase expression